MSKAYTSDGKRRSSQTHARRSHKCGFCEAVSYGNGGKVAHARRHVREGIAVELEKHWPYPMSPSRLFLPVGDAERIARFVEDGYLIVRPQPTGQGVEAEVTRLTAERDAAIERLERVIDQWRETGRAVISEMNRAGKAEAERDALQVGRDRDRVKGATAVLNEELRTSEQEARARRAEAEVARLTAELAEVKRTYTPCDLDLLTERDALAAQVARLAEPGDPDARMDAYYYGFTRTGVGLVDNILSAVAKAGKSYHGTDMWGEELIEGGTCESRIQDAADAAAEQIRVALAGSEADTSGRERCPTCTKTRDDLTPGPHAEGWGHCPESFHFRNISTDQEADRG